MQSLMGCYWGSEEQKVDTHSLQNSQLFQLCCELAGCFMWLVAFCDVVCLDMPWLCARYYHNCGNIQI